MIEETKVNEKLDLLHSQLKLFHGSFHEEVPEQKMSLRFLKGSERVLELGGNIGRNSLIIASIVGSENLVVLESNPDIAHQLKENRDANHFEFAIETCALSKYPLIQKGWDTMRSDVLYDGYFSINTITWEDLQKKYPPFDTLVIDCEGAFYYILVDMPEILDSIRLILMENDYTNIQHKYHIDDVMKGRGFQPLYVESGGWGPCFSNFFEVWTKNS
jgi:FkbM family methyltransferase